MSAPTNLPKPHTPRPRFRVPRLALVATLSCVLAIEGLTSGFVPAAAAQAE